MKNEKRTGTKKIDQFNRTIVDGLIQKDRQLNVDKHRPWKRSAPNLFMLSFFLIKSSTFGKFPKCLVHSTPLGSSSSSLFTKILSMITFITIKVLNGLRNNACCINVPNW